MKWLKIYSGCPKNCGLTTFLSPFSDLNNTYEAGISSLAENCRNFKFINLIITFSICWLKRWVLQSIAYILTIFLKYIIISAIKSDIVRKYIFFCIFSKNLAIFSNSVNEIFILDIEEDLKIYLKNFIKLQHPM